MTTPAERGYAPENEGRPEPTLVQYRDQDFDAAVAAEGDSVTSSASIAYWARAIDDGYTESDRASNADQVAAFEQYQRRPDIESRASILARENAAPAAFENVVVPNGNFDEAVANDAPTNKSGYIGAFNFGEQDANGEIAAASNGQGKVNEDEYTAPDFAYPADGAAGTDAGGSAEPAAPVDGA